MTMMMAGLGAVAGVVILLFAGLYLLVGIGLWKLRNWARITQIVLLIIGLIFGAIGLVGILANFHAGQLIFPLIILAIEAWIVVYLFKPHVKQAFGAA